MESHLTTVKWIIHYIIGTLDIRLWYPHSSNFALISYLDVNFTGNKKDLKITSEMCQILGEALISLYGNKQTSIALSTNEAEYIAMGNCGTQILCIMHQLLDFDLSLESVPIMYSNARAISLSKCFMHHSKDKHIDIKHHFYS